jgi:hypothetical protein
MAKFSDERIIAGDLGKEEAQELYAELRSSGAKFNFNGVNGATGEYGVAPMTGEELAGIIEHEPPRGHLYELRLKLERRFGVEPFLDPNNLAHTGWAVIFPRKTNLAIKESLWDLLALRQEQAGERFKVYEGDAGYRPNETLADFFSRHKISRGLPQPEQMPYYVLLVGSPDEIPYEFQYQLGAMRSVGRIHFDALQDYANYAYYVEQADTGQIALPRRVVFFDVANPGDRATGLSSRYLVQPLYEKLSQKPSSNWQFERFGAEQAAKAQLLQLLDGGQPPAFLFTASHGVEFPAGDSRQKLYQGALLCQDWPGPEEWRSEIPPDFYLAGDDLTPYTRVAGLIAFHFASYGGFVGALPKSLLSHGALAVIGHVERVWGYSILSPGMADASRVYFNMLTSLFNGERVGWAMEHVKMHYAGLATQLAQVMEELEYDPGFINPYDLAQMWTFCNDARSCVVIGDPAVRAPFALPDGK